MYTRLKSCFFVFIIAISISKSTKAQEQNYLTETINFSWVEVPNSSGGVGSQNANISIQNYLPQDNIIVFDVVDSLAGYFRLMGNCSTSEVKSLRQGDFLSSTRVRYQDVEQFHTWIEAKQLTGKLLNAACADQLR